MFKQKFFIYLLSLITPHSIVGMYITKTPLTVKKKFARMAVAKSEALNFMRQTWDINNSPQEVVNISQGKIVIKEEIPLGKRYGVCHNYAFTKLMGIVGKAPKMLNILGQEDYYGDLYLNSHDLFDIREPKAPLHPGDLVLYFSQDEKGKFDEVTHAGIVVGDDCIESKWGPIPAVFEHPIWYVPECFGDYCLYLNLKMSGADLLAEIQKRLQQEQIKKRYDILARSGQQELFDNIKKYEQDKRIDHLHEIHSLLEYQMNVHLDIPDEHGVTPLMHAEKIGCEKLKELFAAYEAHRE